MNEARLDRSHNAMTNRLTDRDPSTDLAERLRQDTGGRLVLEKLDAAAEALTGGRLLFLLRCGDALVEIQPAGRPRPLQGFCRLFRSTALGRKRCLTCRSLMSFGACYRGLIEYNCHGGVAIVAAAAPAALSNGLRPVVASCAFATSGRASGWLAAARQAREAGVNTGRLRGEYHRLPPLTEDRRRAVRALVEIAACVVGDLAQRVLTRATVSHSLPHAAPASTPKPPIEELIGSSLFAATDEPPVRQRTRSGPALVQLVMEMVSREPDILFSAQNIARAAHVTPNHFSAVFRRTTGQTFSAFLTMKRIELAQRLLRDLTLQVSEVARRSGFPDSAYFARRFKQQTGLAPREWRNGLAG
jgi:AraC-like DNA-binding protein